MNKTSNIVIGILAAAALVVGIVAYNKTPDRVVGSQGNTGPQGPRGEQGLPGRDGKDGVTRVVYETPTPNPVLGAVASPDLPYNYIGVGGVRTYSAQLTSLIQGSSTVCAIQSPAATSTLTNAGIRFTLASTSAVSVDLGKGTNRYATTSTFSTYGVGASATPLIVASTTGSGAGEAQFFAPNTYFIVRIASLSSSSGAGNAPTGVCNATFRAF